MVGCCHYYGFQLVLYLFSLSKNSLLITLKDREASFVVYGLNTKPSRRGAVIEGPVALDRRWPRVGHSRKICVLSVRTGT